MFFSILKTCFSILKTCFSILKMGAVVVFLNNYFKNVFPQKYETFIVTTSYNLIYIYSKCQIVCTNCFTQLNNFAEPNSVIRRVLNYFYKSRENLHEIEHVKKGDVFIKYTRYDTFEDVTIEDVTINDDIFFIFSDLSKSNEDKCINKIICKNPQTLGDLYNTYEVSDIQFMLVEVTIDDTIYKINLKDATYNFYIVDNIFDKKFIMYYLKNIYPDEVYCDINKIDTIYITIIDHNVVVKEFDITDNTFIQITKNNYIY